MINYPTSNFTGNVTIDGGVLNILTLANEGVASSLGLGNSTTGADLIFNGGVLQYSGASGNSGGYVTNAGATGGGGNLYYLGQTTNRLFTIGDATGSGNSAAIDSSNAQYEAYNSVVDTISFVNGGKILFNDNGTGASGANSLTLQGDNIGNNTFDPQLTDNPAIGGGATSLVKAGGGTWILGETSTNANSYSGSTTVSGGVLDDLNGYGLPSGSTLILSGGVYQTNGTLSRSLGSSAGNIEFLGGQTGLGAYNGNLNVTIGSSGSTLQFGDAGTFNPSVLILNGPTANGTLTLNNALDLNGATQTILTDGGTAIITGGISNSASATTTAGLTKGGSGVLELQGSGSYNGVTGVAGGTLWAQGSGTLGTSTSTVNVANLAELRLDAASDVAGKVALGTNSTLGLNFNASQATIAGLIGSAATHSVIGIDSSSQSNALNMNTLGNGLMYLGSSTNGVYSAASLTSVGGSEPNSADGTAVFGGAYLLGGGGGTLTITGQNVLTDQPQALFLQNYNSGTTPPSQSVMSSNNYNSVVIGDGYGAGQTNGGGTVDLQASQNYSGTTTINAGSILNLDFTGLGSAGSNILNPASSSVGGTQVTVAPGTLTDVAASGTSNPGQTLTLGQVILAGGTLEMTGKSGATNTQTLNGVSTTFGASTIQVNSNSAASATLNLGTISAGIGTEVNFMNPASGTGQILASNTSLSTGQYTYNNGTNTTWAQVSGGVVGQLSGESTLGTTATTSTTNYVVTIGANGSLTPTTSDSMNLLRFNVTGGANQNGNLAMGANVLTVNGILYNENNQETGKISGTGGITSSSGNLYIDNFSTTSVLANDENTATPAQGDLYINDPLTGTNNVIFGGTGVIDLATTVTTSGNVYLDGAILNLDDGNTNPFGSYTGKIVINGGALAIDSLTSNATFASAEQWNGNFSLLRASNAYQSANTTGYTMSGPILLTNNIAITINDGSTGAWILSGTVSDGGFGYGLTISANSVNQYNPGGEYLNGPLCLSGANTFTGGINVLGDAISFNNGSATNRFNALALAPDTTAYFSATTYQLAGLNDAGGASITETVTGLTTGYTLDLDGNGNYSFGGNVSNGTSASNLYMQGDGGTQTLTGANTFTGTIGAYGGTLIVDASQGGSVTAGTLAFGGGTFVYKGAATGTSVQSFTTTSNAVGGSTLLVNSSLGNTTVNLGGATLTAAGGTLDIDEPYAGATVTSTTGDTNSVWNGAHAVFTNSSGFTTWVTANTSGGTPYTLSGYTGETALGTSGGTNTIDYLLTGSQTQTATTTGNLLRVDNTSVGTLSLGTTALNLTGSNGGGILFDGSASYSITGGTITGVSANGLIIQNYSSAGTTITIGSTLLGGGSNGLTLSGPGTTALTGSNSYNGGTFIDGGIVNFDNLNNFGTTTGINLEGGTLQYASTFIGSNDLTAKTIVVGTAGGTVDTNGNNVTWGGSFGSTSAASSNLNVVDSAATHGSLTMTGTDSDPGTLTIQNGGTVILGNAASGGGVLGNLVSNGTIVGSNGTLEGGTTTTARTGPSSTASYAGKLTLLSGGTIAPGNPTSANVQNVTPDYTHSFGNMGSTATYNVLSASQLTWYAGGTLSFQLDNSSFSNNSQTIFGTTALDPSASTMLNLGTGALHKGGGTGLYVLNFNNTGGYYWDGTNLGTNVYDLINFGGTSATGGPNGDTDFSINDFTIENLDGNGVLSFYYNSAADGGLGQEELLLTVIPEPSTWAMLIGGLVALVFWTRRKRTTTTVRSFIKK